MARDKNALTFFRGDSYPRALIITDLVAKATIDLTDATLVLTVNSLENPEDDTTKVFSSELVPDPDQVSNKGKAFFTPTAENNGQVGSFFYDVQLTDGTGNIRTMIKSTYTIKHDITK